MPAPPIGMEDLEPQPRQVRHERQKVRAQQGAGHVTAREDATLIAGGLLLEQEPGPHPHQADFRVAQLEGVQHPLQVRLLPAIGGIRPPVGGPLLVHPRRGLRTRGVGAHRRGVHQGRHARARHGLEDPHGPQDIISPGDHWIVRGLETPGQMNNGIGVGQIPVQHGRTVLVGEVHGGPPHPRRGCLRPPTRETENIRHFRVRGEGPDDTGPHIAGGPRHRHAQAGMRAHAHLAHS